MGFFVFGFLLGTTVFQQIEEKGYEDKYTFYNRSPRPFSCGLSCTAPDGRERTSFILPIQPYTKESIEPNEKIFLYWIRGRNGLRPIPNGLTYRYYAGQTEGLMLDFTSKEEATLDYDLKEGWNYGEAADSIAKRIKPGLDYNDIFKTIN
jgi:hypothetical protein